MGRVSRWGSGFWGFALAGLVVASSSSDSWARVEARSGGDATIVLYADLDDDDNDGRPDHLAQKLTGRVRAAVKRLGGELGDLLQVDGEAARLFSGDQPLLGKSARGKSLGLQGVSVGESKLKFANGELSVQVL